MKARNRIGMIGGTVLVALLTLVSSRPAAATNLVYDTFESDTLNPTPRLALGNDPLNWIFNTQNANGNGVVDGSVVAVGSPSGGSRSLLLFDNNQVDPRLDTSRLFTQTNIGTRISFDLRVNDVIDSSTDVLYIRMFATAGTGVNGFYLAANGSQDTLNLRNYGDSTLLQTVTTGQWYRIEMTGFNLASAPTTWELGVYDYLTAITNTYTQSRGGTGAGDYFRLSLIAGANASGTIDVSIDNFQVNVPEPTSLALGICGAGSLLLRSRRRG